MQSIKPFARFFIASSFPLVALGSAPTGHYDIRWDDRGGAVLRTHVAPGKFTEWCGQLRLGESVNWEFEAAEPLDMNIHYHEGRNVHYPVQHEAVLTWAGTLQAPVEQQFCWMWTNRRSTPVALQARLQKPPAAR
jgi:hypothetical protein